MAVTLKFGPTDAGKLQGGPPLTRYWYHIRFSDEEDVGTASRFFCIALSDSIKRSGSLQGWCFTERLACITTTFRVDLLNMLDAFTGNSPPSG